MLLAQLCDFLQGYRGPDHDLKAREAILEWAFHSDEDCSKAATEALHALPAASQSPALADFSSYLEVIAIGLPTPRRRGGAAGRRQRMKRAA